MILKVFLIELLVLTPIALSYLVPDTCELNFLLSPCEWLFLGIVAYLTETLYLLSLVFLVIVFKKPKFYRGVFVVLLSNLTFLTFFGIFDNFLLIILLFVPTHLFYYWLLNDLIPKFDKSKQLTLNRK